jgi:hypothetical protein
MTANTVTEFRGRNKFGHRSKTTQRKNSPIRKHPGNSFEPTGCRICNPKIFIRMMTSGTIKKAIINSNYSDKESTKVINTFDRLGY